MSNDKNFFATAFNIKRTLLATKVDENSIAQKVILDVVLNQPLHIPRYDFTALKTLYIFLDNPEVFVKEYFKGWKDTYTFLVEEAPAYHTNPNCDFFLKDFYNVEIPKKIKDKNLIDEARSWSFINRNKLNPKEIEAFKNGFMVHFNQKFSAGLTLTDLETIDRPNSGSEIVKNDIDTVTDEIEKILKSFKEKFSTEKVKFYEREFSYKRYKYKDEYIKQGSYIEYKISGDLNYIKNSFVRPLNRQISDYIFLKFNKEHTYKSSILEFLNFRPCKARACNS
jgi:hypothetical protein